MYVADRARRRGLGRRLLEELESAALASGRTVLRLDTRGDLIEARRLYATHGYREVHAFNNSPYAQHWFAKNSARRHTRADTNTADEKPGRAPARPAGQLSNRPLSGRRCQAARRAG
jgi:GNAT superfamily N-acetyltransferase